MTQPIREIFSAAIDIQSVDERRKYLDEACGGDSVLRDEIEALIQAHQQAGSFLAEEDEPQDPALDDTVQRPRADDTAGNTIGPYKLLQRIGEGGMGSVWMAEQQQPVRRMVALKIIKAGMDTSQVIARFEAERQALALMNHPNIAKVLDAGTTDNGRPYFVMELVKGVPITEFCDKNRYSPQQRLTLFIDVCRAVQHAHQKGIIHRDIKPSNVLVTLHDGVPVVKVIDFGLAKATSQKLTERTLFTAFGQMVGTPSYMSPEQAEMSGLDVDTRTDVYSLGVLLYELMTGTTPIDGHSLRKAGFAEIQRLIQEQEAPPMSTRLSSLGGSSSLIAGKRGSDVNRLAQLLRGDLDVIVLKSLDKDRSRRYSTPNDFADDIQRFLANEVIEARPASVAYRLKKLYQRNRATVLTSALVACVLVLATLFSSVQAIRASIAVKELETEQSKTLAALEKAEMAEASQRELRQQAVAQKLKTDHANDELSTVNENLKQALYISRIHQTTSLLASGEVDRAQHALKSIPFLKHGWELGYLTRLAHGTPLHLHPKNVPFNDAPIYCVAFSPDGKWIAAGDEKGVVRVWDANTGNEENTYSAHDGTVPALTFSPDSKWIASGGSDGLVKFRTVEAGEQQRSFPVDQVHVDCVVFSSDGTKLLTVGAIPQRGAERSTKIWNARTGELVTELDTALAMSAAFSPDGTSVVSCSASDTLTVRDVVTSQVRHTFIKNESDTGYLREMALSPDGKWIASGTTDGTISVWDARNGEEKWSLAGHQKVITQLSFSPDGVSLASCSDDRDVKIWNAQDGELIRTLKGHRPRVFSLAFSPDGTRIIIGGLDRSVKVWDLTTPGPGLTLSAEPDDPKKVRLIR